MAALSENLILQKTKVEKLDLVKSLNLWGTNLTDVSMVKRLANLEVLALSVNRVASLRDIAACAKLKELYLRKNEVPIEEVPYLSHLPALTTLWLIDNPCASHPQYRTLVIRYCPNLKQLDSIEVSPQERAEANRLPGLPGSAVEAPPARHAQTPPKAGRRAPSAGKDGPLGPTQQSPAPIPHVNPPPAAQPQPQPPPSAVSKPGGSQAQRSMVMAVLTLLPELSEESLRVVQKELAKRLPR